MTPQEIKAVVTDVIALHEAGHLEEELALVDAALARDPEVPTLLSLKGAILNDLGRHEEALTQHEAALAHAARIAEYADDVALATGVLWRKRGSTLYDLKRYQEALASYDAALRLDPEEANYWTCRGDTLQALRRYPEAVEAYQRANELLPNDPSTLMGLSTALRSAKRYAEALETAEQALAHAFGDEQVANVLWRKAHALWHVQRRDEALADMEQACALQPNNLTYWLDKTGLLFRMGRWRAGWQALQYTQSLSDRWHQQQRARRASK